MTVVASKTSAGSRLAAVRLGAVFKIDWASLSTGSPSVKPSSGVTITETESCLLNNSPVRVALSPSCTRFPDTHQAWSNTTSSLSASVADTMAVRVSASRASAGSI